MGCEVQGLSECRAEDKEQLQSGQFPLSALTDLSAREQAHPAVKPGLPALPLPPAFGEKHRGERWILVGVGHGAPPKVAVTHHPPAALMGNVSPLM